MLEPDFISRFTSHLKETLQKALTFAIESGRELVTPGDLIVGLLQEKGSIGSELLMKAGAILETAIATFRGTPDHAQKGETITPDLSHDVKRILERCILLAHIHEHKFVGTEHLVGAILAIFPAEIKPFFDACNINHEVVKEKISNILTSTSKFPDLSSSNIMDEGDIGASLRPQPMQRTKMSSALEAFSRDLTHPEVVATLDPVIGRDRELDRTIEILCRRTKNNPILLGEPGVGKTAVVEGLAKRLADGDVPDALHGKRILSVDLALTVAGTMYRGEFEARLKQLVDEVKADPNVILFIDEIHNIVGAGSTSGSLDAANILKPALSRGEIRCIGATTWSEFKKHIETDAALERRFQHVSIEQPTPSATRDMILGLRTQYERYHGVTYEEDALEAAVQLADRYLTDRMFPDKAIDLIDEAAASVIASRKNHELMERLRSLEIAQNDAMDSKEEAVAAQRLEEAAELRKRELKLQNEYDTLIAHVENERQKAPLRVTARDVASVVARLSNVSLETVMATERERMHTLEEQLKLKIIGQDDAIHIVADAVRKARLGLGDERRPRVSLLFAGPSGTGKTELARTLAVELFGREDALLKIDMSEFAEGYAASKLLGSPAGYVGYRESNKFTDAIRKRPHAVVCFDEVEKAHPDVLNLLLQLLEDGHVTDATGRLVSFRHAYVVLTSNVGADALGKTTLGFEQTAQKGSAFSDIVRSEINDRFRPELINRIDRIVIFQPLEKQHLKSIVKKELTEALRRVEKAQQVACHAGEDVLNWLLAKPISEKEGARAARRIVEREITDLIGRLLAEKPKKRSIRLKATSQGLRAI